MNSKIEKISPSHYLSVTFFALLDFFTSMFSRCISFFRKKRIENEGVSGPSCKPNLQNMPIVVVEEMLKDLDVKSIFCLRKVCRDLRFSIDRIQPKLHVRSLSFKLPLTKKLLKSHRKGMSEHDRKYMMHRLRPRTGCELKWESGGSTRYSRITMEDGETLLKNTKIILDVLDIDFLLEHFFEGKNSEKIVEDLMKFRETMKSLLKNRCQLLKTKEVYLEVKKLSEAAELLKCIDPKSLKTISIHTGVWRTAAIEINISELETLEQWKNADVLKIRGNHILSFIETFASFKSVTLSADVIEMEKLNEVIEFFLSSPKMKKFIIESHRSELKDQLISCFDEIDSNDEQLQIMLFLGYKYYLEFSKV